MLYLSELYGRIGQILHEHGDMEVTRMQDRYMDGLTNAYSGFMEFDNTNFYVHQSSLTEATARAARSSPAATDL